jgi:hypothetical protein
MAIFVSHYVATLESSGGLDFTVILPSTALDVTASDNDSDSPTFAGGETIQADNGAETYAYTYVASYGDGWIGEPVNPSDPFDFYYFSFSTQVSAPFTATAGSFVTCFLTGTHIATPTGPRPVEALGAGDIVLDLKGTPRTVRWVGRQTVVKAFADPLRSHPVRIAAGALGDGLPVRDLLVSPDHAILIDGVLVQAAALINGRTVCRVEPAEPIFTYHHVELDGHALILAEGVAAESFVDNVTRRRFDNFAAFEALYGDEGPVVAELPIPRIKAARQLPLSIRRRLAGVDVAPGADAA